MERTCWAAEFPWDQSSCSHMLMARSHSWHINAPLIDIIGICYLHIGLQQSVIRGSKFGPLEALGCHIMGQDFLIGVAKSA